MTNPLISILMPVKNTAPFLEECLNSICQQTEQYWELLTVNDHSTDTSNLILDAFSKKDTRIKVFQNDGKGIIDALRLAYHQSEGKLITRMDADDKMEAQKLAVLKKQLLTYGQGYLATGLVQYFSAMTLGMGYQKYQTWLNQLTKTGQNFSEIYKECVIPSPCWMVFRSDLECCQAFQPDRYPEDYDLCFRFYKNNLKIIPNNQVLHQWRDHPNRSSRNDEHYADNRFLDLKLDYFLQLDYNENRPLSLWGAGKKGKIIAKNLLAHNIPFYWVCNNTNKIGATIYGQSMQAISLLESLEYPQIIIAVAGDFQQTEIIQYLSVQKKVQGIDYFFFC